MRSSGYMFIGGVTIFTRLYRKEGCFCLSFQAAQLQYPNLNTNASYPGEIAPPLLVLLDVPRLMHGTISHSYGAEFFGIQA